MTWCPDAAFVSFGFLFTYRVCHCQREQRKLFSFFLRAAQNEQSQSVKFTEPPGVTYPALGRSVNKWAFW